MSIQLGNFVSNILLDHFGDIVEKVGSDLYRFGDKTIPLIAMTTHLPKSQIKKSLCALIKYSLVTFEQSKSHTCAEYRLCHENILLLLRYPKYILHIKNRYGKGAEMIVEEILQEGSISMSKLIINIMIKSKDDRERDVSVISLRDIIIVLITAGYIRNVPKIIEESDDGSAPLSIVNNSNVNTLPEIDIQTITKIVNGDFSLEIKDDLIYKIDMDRFHQDFRDELLITAMTRSIDDCGGELMRQLLQIMYSEKNPWAPSSKPIAFIEIKNCCKKSTDKPMLNNYLEQYLSIMENSSGGIVSYMGGASGGQYTLKLARAAKLLVWDLLYSTVQERLGTKAARIFRLIKAKKYIEEENIQKHAMLPAKEAKQLTYKLLQEQFIEIRPLRKNASGGAGPSKAFYLYYIDLNHVANMLLETVYKALYNVISRREHERSLNKYMIDKQQRVDTIVHNMRLRGEAEENIKDIEETVTPPEKLALERITTMIKKLSCAEVHLYDTMFILQMFFIYQSNV